MSRQTFKKKITSEELINKINPQSKKLVDRFLKNFETKRSATSTKVYRSNFMIFLCWNVENNDNKAFTEIKKLDFMDFFDYASTELQWSPSRYAQMWSTLNSLGTFIENILDEEYPDFRNQVKKIEKLPKSAVRKKTILREAQVDNLLGYLSDEINNPQEACLLALAICSGARISELFRFTTHLIDENNTAYDDVFLETTDEIVTKGRGKHGTLKHKYILKNLFLKYYKPWLEERAVVMEQTEKDHDFIFIKPNGEPAEVATGRSWMEKWERYLTDLEPTNIKHEQVYFYPHCLRHYLCTYLAKRNIPQELIVELFGWASADMFNIYNDNTLKDKKWKELTALKTEHEDIK